jgi:anion-transporting  ArsA/GET3 family ATPase
LLDTRLVFVTGKGGTGKSTVAAAVGLLAARRGKRAIVCEVAGQQRVHSALLDGDGELQANGGGRFAEVELAPNLYGISIDPELALEEYLSVQLGSRTLFRALTRNRIFHYLTVAAPGVRELATIGKAWELAQPERWTGADRRYDLVVVDGPATGHGVAMLRTPRTFREIARVGTIRRQAGRIDSFLRDRRRTAVIAVATGDEMPVNETLDLDARLREEVGVELWAVIANALYPERFSATEARRLERASSDLRSESARAAVRAALSEHHRAVIQREQLRRLDERFEQILSLPYLFRPELGRAQLEHLAGLIEEQL